MNITVDDVIEEIKCEEQRAEEKRKRQFKYDYDQTIKNLYYFYRGWFRKENLVGDTFKEKTLRNAFCYYISTNNEFYSIALDNIVRDEKLDKIIENGKLIYWIKK